MGASLGVYFASNHHVFFITNYIQKSFYYINILFLSLKVKAFSL